jgi:hypothetical protein
MLGLPFDWPRQNFKNHSRSTNNASVNDGETLIRGLITSLLKAVQNADASEYVFPMSSAQSH